MLAGLLFGYDQGVISGALTGIEQTFDISTFMLEVITSWVTLGAMAGALVAGALADRQGRRRTILIAAVIFIAGALLESLAPEAWVLVIGRLVLGFGVGVASVAAPLYAAEMAPARYRGRMVSLYQMAITIGIFLAYWADYLLLEQGDSDSWRVMLGVSAIPAVLLVFAMWPLADSPRWYMKAGRRAEAERALAKVEPDANVAAELDAVQAAIESDEDATWREVFVARWRGPLKVGLALAVLQQLTGINAIIYYADKIFAAAGFESPTSQSLATLWAIGAVNVVATLVAVFWVDRFGRKPLMLIGSTGMCLSLVAVGGAFYKLGSITTSTTASSTPTNAGIIALVGLVVFIASFAFSLGPVVWTIINEIFPAHIRGKGVAVATGANWFAAWLVSQFFLTLVDLISEEGTFWLFAGFCALTFVYVRWFVPETKGKTLEQVEHMWGDEAELRAAISTWD
jgi:sugar porter (SP) family MFS transporter